MACVEAGEEHIRRGFAQQAERFHRVAAAYEEAAREEIVVNDLEVQQAKAIARREQEALEAERANWTRVSAGGEDDDIYPLLAPGIPTTRGERMRDTPKLAYNEGRLEDARRLLLEEYSRKEVRRLVQIDGFQAGTGDDVMRTDEDGHCLMAGEDYALLNIGASPHLPVRVQACEGADKQEVLTLLRKITAWVERDWDSLRTRFAGEERPGAHPNLRRIK
jgi:hypothetical protein